MNMRFVYEVNIIRIAISTQYIPKAKRISRRQGFCTPRPERFAEGEVFHPEPWQCYLHEDVCLIFAQGSLSRNTVPGAVFANMPLGPGNVFKK